MGDFGPSSVRVANLFVAKGRDAGVTWCRSTLTPALYHFASPMEARKRRVGGWGGPQGMHAARISSGP